MNQSMPVQEQTRTHVHKYTFEYSLFETSLEERLGMCISRRAHERLPQRSLGLLRISHLEQNLSEPHVSTLSERPCADSYGFVERVGGGREDFGTEGAAGGRAERRGEVAIRTAQRVVLGHLEGDREEPDDHDVP